MTDPRRTPDRDPEAPASEPSLKINEIYLSIQGESTWAGLPCTFVRLTGCHLRCTYCDSEYAFTGGTRMPLGEIVEKIQQLGCPVVEITGGEPLLQAPVHDLMTMLLDKGMTVLLETSGACDISTCDPRVIRIVDLKTPSSGQQHRNLMENLDHLASNDQVKFVIGDQQDYEWSKQLLEKHDLVRRCDAVLFSPVHEQPTGTKIAGAPGMDPQSLAEWIIRDRIDVRFQLQLHKFIWDPHARGV
ncbi:MAG: 7-carboxy-7-deazaguanine synthase QueE [Phycisphaerae bacterium]|nr:7-carboxy-7-deazaguanine synthase QueE [Phycisphaerae bacterium]